MNASTSWYSALSANVADAAYVEAVCCESSSSAAEYQHMVYVGGGAIESNTTYYRNNADAWPDSNQKVSYKISTGTDVGTTYPVRLPLPAPPHSDLTASGDTYTWHLQCNTTLTDRDVWIQLIYPDSTNKHTPKTAESVSSAFDPMRSGTTLTTSSEGWNTSLTNKYQISVTASSGAECMPDAYIYLAKSLGANDIYICAQAELS